MDRSYIINRIVRMLEDATEEQLRIIWVYIRTLLHHSPDPSIGELVGGANYYYFRLVGSRERPIAASNWRFSQSG